jgi:hypothetical protein
MTSCLLVEIDVVCHNAKILMFEKMLFTHSLFSFPASCCGLLRFASHKFFQKKNRKKKADNPSGQQRKPKGNGISRRVARQHTAIRRSQHFALPLCRSFGWACGVAARYNLAAFLPVDCGNFLF